MNSPECAFPPRELTEADRQIVLMGCGVDSLHPNPRPVDVQMFFDLTVYPAFKNNSAEVVLSTLSHATAHGEDLPEYVAEEAFRDGALFFAGVRNVVNNEIRLPIEPNVFVGYQRDDLNPAWIGKRSVEVITQAESFCELSDELLPAMFIDGRGDKKYESWLAGAGAMHLLVQASQQWQAERDALEFLDQFPDLGELFK